jgi:hypothetical protein
MNTLTNTDDDAEEQLGPSLAYPPLYVLRTATRCPACDKALHVYALGCSAYHVVEHGGEPIEQFHFLQRIESIPQSLLTLIKRQLPDYYLDHTEEAEPPYLMNHCPCGAKFDDDYLHGDVGAAFWPDTPEGFRQLSLFRLPIEEAIPVVSSFTIGGGDYLDTEHAESWRAGQG